MNSATFKLVPKIVSALLRLREGGRGSHAPDPAVGTNLQSVQQQANVDHDAMLLELGRRGESHRHHDFCDEPNKRAAVALPVLGLDGRVKQALPLRLTVLPG